MQVRLGGVKCLSAVLQQSSSSSGTPPGSSEPNRAAPIGAIPDSVNTQGLFEDVADQPLLAYTAHTLLGVAEGEAAAGAQGSRVLRAAALRALRLLLERAGADGTALAAILPGTASGLAKALQVASEA